MPLHRRHSLRHYSPRRFYSNPGYDRRSSPSKLFKYATTLAVVSATAYGAYLTWEPFRYMAISLKRCSVIGQAVILDIIDYKRTLGKQYNSLEAERMALSECHSRSANRVLQALLKNGGIFVKLGQHVSSLIVLPIEWTSTMRPLQDQCRATPYEDMNKMVLEDSGKSIPDWFDDFNEEPIGVASLAQVHEARYRQTGHKVAVKLQHPFLNDFCDIDMAMVEFSLAWVKRVFPDFEFTWLGEEMRENLPKELDFINEAANAARLEADFKNVQTSLYIPKILFASKRILIMEYIDGARIDDKEYLARENIDRNLVALELARVFSRMVHLNGWFHADPHLGNLLIRRSPPSSRSPYNFDIVMLDHGLHFDIDDDLRINYSKLWLSLISPPSPDAYLERRKYAQIVGNVGPDLYPVFQTAITGRIGLQDAGNDLQIERPGSMVDMLPQTAEELDLIRKAVMEREGVLQSVFDVLRRVPRRVLMLLKLNDLTRSLDHALDTTHSNIRVLLITARYCCLAVWDDERRGLRAEFAERGFSPKLVSTYFRLWLSYQWFDKRLCAAELLMDVRGRIVLMLAWIRGFYHRGFLGAHRAAAGLN